MLYIINSISDPYFDLVKQDPVRPGIPFERRIGLGRCIFVLVESDIPLAVTCVSLQNSIPTKEEELFLDNQNAEVAVFYTIWNIQPGSASSLLNQTLKYIKQEKPKIKRFLTLSPKTDMARRFHIRNGARVLSENTNSINYEYS